MPKKTISLIQIKSMKKIPLVFFLLMSYISVGQDLTVISGGSITIPTIVMFLLVVILPTIKEAS
jgi:hypothetical protein